MGVAAGLGKHIRPNGGCSCFVASCGNGRAKANHSRGTFFAVNGEKHKREKTAGQKKEKTDGERSKLSLIYGDGEEKKENA